MKVSKRIYALDGLKGISAILIAFFYHYYAHFCVATEISNVPLANISGFIFKNGFLAVELFFMISGFTTYYCYHEKIKNKEISIILFLYKRIKSFLYIFLVTLVLIILEQLIYLRIKGNPFVDTNFDALHFFKTIFLLEGNVFNEYSFNLPTWFVSTLVLLYIIFYLTNTLEAVLNEKAGIIIYCIIAIWGWIGMLLHVDFPLWSTEFSARGYATFFSGILICKIVKKKHKNCYILGLLFFISVFFISLIAMKFGLPGQGKLRILIMWILYPALLVIACTRNVISKFLESKPLVQLGGISNYIYFWHFSIQILIAIILACLRVERVSGVILLPIYVISVLAISIFTRYIALRIRTLEKNGGGGH